MVFFLLINLTRQMFNQYWNSTHVYYGNCKWNVNFHVSFHKWRCFEHLGDKTYYLLNWQRYINLISLDSDGLILYQTNSIKYSISLSVLKIQRNNLIVILDVNIVLTFNRFFSKIAFEMRTFKAMFKYYITRIKQKTKLY